MATAKKAVPKKGGAGKKPKAGPLAEPKLPGGGSKPKPKKKGK